MYIYIYMGLMQVYQSYWYLVGDSVHIVFIPAMMMIPQDCHIFRIQITGR